MIPVISIILAFGLPAYGIYKSGRAVPLKRPYLYSVASFAACACGIIAEIFRIKQRLFTGDIGGIEDTIGAFIIICVGLLVITTVLNLLLLGLNYEKE